MLSNAVPVLSSPVPVLSSDLPMMSVGRFVPKQWMAEGTEHESWSPEFNMSLWEEEEEESSSSSTSDEEDDSSAPSTCTSSLEL